jgi:hypothetical protein
VLDTIQLILAIAHGTFIFPKEPVYGWYLSCSAIGLNISWSLHNVIAWMKNKPFLSRKVSYAYIITVLLAQPYWVVEIYANFTYFNNINKIFLTTRPMEPLFRSVSIPAGSLPYYADRVVEILGGYSLPARYSTLSSVCITLASLNW